MKTLYALIPSAVKAILGVILFIASLGWTAYYSVEVIAEAQAQVVEAKVMAVRDADFQHFNGRFDRTDAKLDKLIELAGRK